MKKFTFLLLLFFTVMQNTYAQQPFSDSLGDQVRYIFANVDKDAVSSGYLEEYGAEFVSFVPFDGVLTDSNSVDKAVFRLLYGSLLTGKINNTAALLPSLANVNDSAKSIRQRTGAIPIPIMLIDYNSIRPDALTQNLLNVINGQLYDVPNRSENPYMQHVLFAVAPLEDKVKGGSANFIFPSHLFLSNKNVSITSIEADFGHGMHTYSPDEPFNISYSNPGAKQITFTVSFSNGTILKCYSTLFVDYIDSRIYSRYGSVNETLYIDPDANQSGGTVSILYGSTGGVRHTSLQKPLIVAKGYDVSYAAPDLQSNYDVYAFLSDLDNPKKQNGYDFNAALDDVGYDLVFIDYNDGTDDIRRNAALVEKVINTVNSLKTTSEQNVVMGVSMGGLVARYALAEMTKSGKDTKTRLLITHDSPHRGANVPIGLQDLVLALANDNFLPFNQRFTDYVPELTETVNLLKEPATQQLLLYRSQVSRRTTSFGYSYFQYNVINNGFIENTYRNMITFSPSDPQPGYKMIATSDGAECGQGSLNPGGLIADISGDIRVKHSLGFKYRLSMQVNSLPVYGQSGPILHISFSSNRTILILPIKRTLFELTLTSNGLIPVDNMPSGLYSVNTFAPEIGPIHTVTDTSFLFFTISIHADFTPTVNDFTFVPTTSALDIPYITNGTPKFVDGFLPSGYTSNFKTFIAAEPYITAVGGNNVTKYNQLHTTFTGRNAHWLYDEMEGISNTLNCSAECTPDNSFSIQGNDMLCSSSTYSVPGLPANATVTWSTTPSGIVNLSSNGNQVTVTRITNGAVTLTANISSSCASLQVQKRIQVLGVPNITQINIEKNGPSCLAGQSLSFGATYNGNYRCDLSNDGITEVDWQVSSPQSYQITFNAGFYACSSNSVINPGISLYFSPPITPFMLTLKARVKNKCGEWSGWTPGYSFQIKSCSPFFFTISPNPASEAINISSKVINKQYSKIGEAGNNGFIKEVKIYTSSGKIVKQQQFNGNASQVQIDVSSLTPGIYLVNISDGQHTETQKLVIGK